MRRMLAGCLAVVFVGAFAAACWAAEAEAPKTEELAKSTSEVVVVSVADKVLTATVGDKRMEFTLPDKRGARGLIRGLVKGDKITLVYTGNAIDEVTGQGTVTGTVSAKKDASITIKTADGVEVTMNAPWVGGSPRNSGAPDKAVVEQIKNVQEGQKVTAEWKMLGGKRLVSVKVAEG